MVNYELYGSCPTFNPRHRDTGVSPPQMYLQGLHRVSGNWVTLLPVKSEDTEKLMRALWDSRQPDIRIGLIKHEDFSAFRVEPMTHVSWVLGN